VVNPLDFVVTPLALQMQQILARSIFIILLISLQHSICALGNWKIWIINN